MSALSGGDARARIAVLSLHTSPEDPPGDGDSGGMNVWVRSVARRLAEREVAVDVFTRCAGRGVPEVDAVHPLTRVIQVPAGPCAPVEKSSLPGLVPAFTEGILGHPVSRGLAYDVVHSHYWLSGSVARGVRRRWGIPLVASFHTLGKVKNRDLQRAERPEPAVRVDGETAVVREADRILASTPEEAAHLEWLYGAAPERVRIVPPGVAATAFRPLPKARARAALGLGNRTVALFLGRLQPLKGPDVALRAVAAAVRRDPRAAGDLVLAVVGGPSGPDRMQAGQILRLAGELGIADRVRLFAPRPHDRLPEVYAAADVVLVPSRSESFGLVALEAQACGVPVIAASVGGLRTVVVEGRTGSLVPGHDPRDHADRLLDLLRDPRLARRMSRAAVVHAARFSWEATAERVMRVYGELVPGLARAEEVPA